MRRRRAGPRPAPAASRSAEVGHQHLDRRTPYRSASSAASCSSRSRVRDTRTRSWPDAASRWAKDRPMPEVGPVTRRGGSRHASSIHGRCAGPQHGCGMMAWCPPPRPGSSRSPTRRVASPRPRPSPRSAPRSPSSASRVLLVDLDPQACLTFSLGIDPEDLELSVHHVLTKGLDATRGDRRDRRRRRPAAGDDRAGARRGRPAHPHRPRARA